MARNDGFYDFEDHFEYQKRMGNLDAKETIAQYTAKTIHMAYENRKKLQPGLPRMMTNSALGTLYFHQIGRPYIKVHPGMAQMLSKTKLTIPCSEIKLPFGAFEVRMPVKNNPLTEGSHAVRGMMVLANFTADSNKMDLTKGHFPVEVADYDDVRILMDFGTTTRVDGYDYKYFHFFALRLSSHQSLFDAFKESVDAATPPTSIMGGSDGLDLSSSRTIRTKDEWQPSPDTIRRALAICVSSIFFMTNKHEVVAPDIPRRYVERYHKALKQGGKVLDKELTAIQNEAKKMNHFGWSVGKEIELPQPEVKHVYGRGGESDYHWELSTSHVRSGHFAWRWIGPRDKPDLKLVWIAPTIVRPDLPMGDRPRHPGYVIPDDLKRKEAL